jgi:nucleoside-specific outer membrane channel protein Tsx
MSILDITNATLSIGPMAELNLNVASTFSSNKNENNSFFILSCSVKIYLIAGAIATDIQNAILTVGPMAVLNLNVASSILFQKNENNSFFQSILIFCTVLRFIKLPGSL